MRDGGEATMLQQPESACLLIADISGYTGFLPDVERDHAHDIIADLMETLVKALRPPFRVAKFEGDAVFLNAPAEKIDVSHCEARPGPFMPAGAEPAPERPSREFAPAGPTTTAQDVGL